MSERYRKPDGSTTAKFAEYAAAWHELARPIEEEFGVTLWAYDPDLSFKKKGKGCYLDLPVDFAVTLKAILTRLEEKE